MTVPLPHQQRELDRSIDKSLWALQWEPGTGKTFYGIRVADWWYRHRKCRLIVVFAPNGVHANWLGEIEKHADPNVPRDIAIYRSGSLGKFTKTLEQWRTADRVANAYPRQRWMLINIEACSSPTSAAVTATRDWFKYAQMRGEIAGLFVDEFHYVRTPSAIRTRTIWTLASMAPLRRIFSGTPSAKGYENLYAPYRVLDWRLLGAPTYAAFKALYCISQTITLDDRRTFAKIIGYQNLPLLVQRLNACTGFATLDECVDLPPVIGGITSPLGPMIIPVEMSPCQRTAYRDLKDHMLVELRNGEIKTWAHAIARLGKLHQISGGFLSDGTEIIERFLNPKVAALCSLLETTDEKSFVWCAYRPEVDFYTEQLRMAGLAVFPHHGGMDDAARETIRNGWRAATGPAVLVSTIATGGTGFTLNEATISIFASSTFEYDKRLQAERRNLRIGQGKRVVYYDLIANGSLDRHVLRNLLRKQDLAKMLTSSPADTLHDLLTSDAEVAP